MFFFVQLRIQSCRAVNVHCIVQLEKQVAINIEHAETLCSAVSSIREADGSATLVLRGHHTSDCFSPRVARVIHPPRPDCCLAQAKVVYGVCEVPSMKVLTRGMRNEHCETQSLISAGSRPPIPCYAGR